MTVRYPLVIVLILAAAPAAADVYRWVDPEGNVIFSDTPREGAEKVEIGETTVVPALKAPPPPPPSPAPDPEAESVGYESVTVTQPAHEATLRNVQNVDVSVLVSPPLKTHLGHRLQLYVDGAPFEQPTKKTSFVLPEVPRGAHELEAAVLDRAGQELGRSPVSVFFLHRTSILNPRPGGAP